MPGAQAKFPGHRFRRVSGVDQTNYRKSVDQLLRLLQVLDCDVELVVRAKKSA